MTLKCSSCGSAAVIHDTMRGERICTRCGFVLMEKQLEPGPDWHTEPGETVGRADVSSGIDITHHDWDLGTHIGMSKDVSPSWRAKARRLQKWQQQSRATTYGQKSLRKALIDLDKLCVSLTLPKTIQGEASFLYRKARVKKLTAGRSTWGVLAALTLIASRRRQAPRATREVAQALAIGAELDEKEAEALLKQLVKALSKGLKVKVPIPTPKDYIARFSTKLGSSQDVVERSHEICDSLPATFRRRKAAFVLAATVTYLAVLETGKRVTLREASEAMGVSISSLSTSVKQVQSELKQQ